MQKLIRVLFFSLVSMSAYGEVLHVADTGFIVENSYQTAASPEQAWEALINDIGRWWPADHTWFGDSANLSIEAKANGCFCEIDGERQVMHMQISFVDPGRLLRMTGGLGPMQQMGMTGALDWRIEAGEGGSTLTLTYRVNGINPDGFAELAPIVDAVQAQQLGGLGLFLDDDVTARYPDHVPE